MCITILLSVTQEKILDLDSANIFWEEHTMQHFNKYISTGELKNNTTIN
jgi:hypothetical protein